MTEWQSIINLAIGAGIAVGGWFARELFDSVKELREMVHKLEVDLPSNYIKRDDFKEGMARIEDLFGEVFKKIDDLKDRKADK